MRRIKQSSRKNARLNLQVPTRGKILNLYKKLFYALSREAFESFCMLIGESNTNEVSTNTIRTEWSAIYIECSFAKKTGRPGFFADERGPGRLLGIPATPFPLLFPPCFLSLK